MIDKAFAVETNGINPIAEHERKGTPRDLFWPWFAANVSVLSVSYGSFVLAFGMSVWQALAVVVIGVIASNLLCGYIATAGRRGSAPTMTLSRSAFGVRGNRLPSLLSWMLTVGWETSLVVVAVLATSTIFERLGWTGGVLVKVVALLVIVVMIVAGGMLGFDVIMKLQRWLTVLTAVLTALYIAFTINKVDWHALAALPSGGTPIVIGAILFVMTGFGLGWVNAAADYSRYLPRTASSKGGIIGWTTLGCSLPPAVLLIYGVLLSGSSSTLNDAIASDPRRRTDHDPAHLVPHPLRGGHRGRFGGRRHHGHLLVRSGPAEPGPEDLAGDGRRGSTRSSCCSVRSPWSSSRPTSSDRSRAS